MVSHGPHHVQEHVAVKCSIKHGALFLRLPEHLLLLGIKTLLTVLGLLESMFDVVLEYIIVRLVH